MPAQENSSCFLINIQNSSKHWTYCFPACLLAVWILPAWVNSLASFLWRGAHPLCVQRAELCRAHIVFNRLVVSQYCWQTHSDFMTVESTTALYSFKGNGLNERRSVRKCDSKGVFHYHMRVRSGFSSFGSTISGELSTFGPLQIAQTLITANRLPEEIRYKISGFPIFSFTCPPSKV